MLSRQINKTLKHRPNAMKYDVSPELSHTEKELLPKTFHLYEQHKYRRDRLSAGLFDQCLIVILDDSLHK